MSAGKSGRRSCARPQAGRYPWGHLSWHQGHSPSLELEQDLWTQKRELAWSEQGFILGAGLLGKAQGQSLVQSPRWMPVTELP